MKITDFLGEVVICPGANKRYVITEITSPYITAREEKPGGNGYYKHYRWDTVNWGSYIKRITGVRKQRAQRNIYKNL